MDLVQMLTSQLGVSNQQAQGGAGLLLQAAKAKLGDGEFSKLAQGVPGVEGMLGAAPKPDGIQGALGGMLGGLGGGAATLGQGLNLANGFSQLGLDKSSIGKFIPVLLQFFQGQGGDKLALIQKAMQGLGG